MGTNKYAYLGDFRWHHFYTGLLVTALAIMITYAFPKQKTKSFALLGIGLDLIIDEITLPLYLAGLDQVSYWSVYAIILGILVLFVLGLCTFRRSK